MFESLARSRRWWAALAAVAAGIAPAVVVTAPAEAATTCPATGIRPISPVDFDAVSVALDGRGGFYLSSATGQVSRVDIATGTARTVATGLGNLRGIATDRQGTVYVADFAGRVLAVDAATGASRILAQGLGSVLGVAYAQGKVYAAESTSGGALWELTPGQAPRAVARGFDAVADIAADGQGHLAVVELTGGIYRVDVRTGARQGFDSGELYEPTSVQFAADGRILFFTAASELQAADPATGSVSELCGSFPAYDFALDSRGNAVVLDLADQELRSVHHLAG